MTEENQKPSFWHNVGKKYPAPTICVLLTTISALMTVIALGGSAYLSDIKVQLSGLEGMKNSLTRLDTTVAGMQHQQDRSDEAVQHLIQIVMEQKRGR